MNKWLLFFIFLGFCLLTALLSFFFKGPGFLLSLCFFTVLIFFYFLYKMAQIFWDTPLFPQAAQVNQKKPPHVENQATASLEYARLKQILLELEQDFEEGRISQSEYEQQNKQIRAQAIQFLYLSDQQKHSDNLEEVDNPINKEEKQ